MSFSRTTSPVARRAQTVSFSLDGSSYEIDLNDENAGALRDALSVYVGHARKTNGGARPPRPGARGVARVDREQIKAIREWAKRNDQNVSDRGRIPAHVLEAYNKAIG